VHPRSHLAEFTGVLQVDGYTGFNRLTGDRPAGRVELAFCWAHYLEPVFMLGGRSASQRSPVMAASGTRHNSRRRVAIRRRVGERHADSTANIVER
jgi:Transposase IS66 family